MARDSPCLHFPRVQLPGGELEYSQILALGQGLEFVHFLSCFLHYAYRIPHTYQRLDTGHEVPSPFSPGILRFWHYVHRYSGVLLVCAKLGGIDRLFVVYMIYVQLAVFVCEMMNLWRDGYVRLCV